MFVIANQQVVAGLRPGTYHLEVLEVGPVHIKLSVRTDIPARSGRYQLVVRPGGKSEVHIG